MFVVLVHHKILFFTKNFNKIINLTFINRSFINEKALFNMKIKNKERNLRF